MKRFKSIASEFLLSLAYSAGGSLGLYCLLSVWGMALGGLGDYPVRLPFMFVCGIFALFFCIFLLVFDLNRKGLWSWWQRLMCRIAIVALTFVPFLLLWKVLVRIGDQLIGTD